MMNYASSDFTCSGSIVSNDTSSLPNTCASVSSFLPAGALTTRFKDTNCNNPAYLLGNFAGFCYLPLKPSNAEGGYLAEGVSALSYQFQSCDSSGNGVIADYVNPYCAGAPSSVVHSQNIQACSNGEVYQCSATSALAPTASPSASIMTGPTGYLIDSCERTDSTYVYPIGVCAGDNNGGNIIYSVMTNATAITVLKMNYASSDSTCSGSIVSTDTSSLPNTCGSVSASQPAGQFTTYTKHKACNRRFLAYQLGNVDGVCYFTTEGFVQSYQFRSCDSSGNAVMAFYFGNSHCGGTASFPPNPNSHTCSASPSGGTQVYQCIAPSLAPVTASPSAVLVTASPSSATAFRK